jgi:hypothetical protein
MSTDLAGLGTALCLVELLTGIGRLTGLGEPVQVGASYLVH